jgi:hypothetical protein
MWGEHDVDLPIAEVEVAKLQRCYILLIYVNCTYPLQEVRSDQFILKVSGHTASVYCATKRW